MDFHLHFEIVLYVVFGLLAVAINASIIIAVFSSRQLRVQKEFVIIAGLCLTDAINGLVFVLIGVYRLRVLVEWRADDLVSRMNCLSTVPQMTSVGIDQAFAWMLLVVTVDRLFAVYLPIRYFKQTHWYAWKALFVVFFTSTVFVIVAFVFTREFTAPEVSPLCYTSDSVHPSLYRIYEITRVSTVAFSVLLYAPICWKLYFISKQHETGAYTSKKYERLKNITITVALSTATSVFLVLVPDIIVVFDLFELQKFSSYFFSVTILKSCINVLIYVVRNPLIYRQLRRFCTCCHLFSQGATISQFTLVQNVSLACRSTSRCTSSLAHVPRRE